MTTMPASDRHAGYHKAPDDLDGQTNKDRKLISEKIMKLHTTMMNAVQKFGYTITRWREILEVFLEKDKGKPRMRIFWPVRKLRQTPQCSKTNYGGWKVM